MRDTFHPWYVEILCPVLLIVVVLVAVVACRQVEMGTDSGIWRQRLTLTGLVNRESHAGEPPVYVLRLECGPGEAMRRVRLIVPEADAASLRALAERSGEDATVTGWPWRDGMELGLIVERVGLRSD